MLNVSKFSVPNPKASFWLFGAGLCALALLAPNLAEQLDAQDYMVIQYPWGELTVKTEPGIYTQWFGKVTKYHRRDQFSFSKAPDQGRGVDESIHVQFNDGGLAKISGVISWEMPSAPESIIKLHKEFGSQIGVESQLVRPSIERAVYLSGALMSSTESAGERRPELLRFIDDMAQNGVYETQTTSKKILDPLTQTERSVNVVEIILGKDGRPSRVSTSALQDLGVRLQPVAINSIDYNEVVSKQIAERQRSITDVQNAIAQAKKAEQDAITVAKQGEAAAAKAKWEQEVEKAKAVTKAEQELEVAKLAQQAADATKKRLILEGEGEAAKRQAIMNADGGLDKKLEAFVKVNTVYAEAISHYQGNWTPGIQMGQGAAANGVGNATGLVDLLTAKTAKDLSLDLGLSGAAATGKKK